MLKRICLALFLALGIVDTLKSQDITPIFTPTTSGGLSTNDANGLYIRRDGTTAPTATISFAGQSLQNVNALTTSNFVLRGITYPVADGTANQVLKTDGAGTLSFTTVSVGVATNVVNAWTATQIMTNLLIGTNATFTTPGTGPLTISVPDSAKVFHLTQGPNNEHIIFLGTQMGSGSEKTLQIKLNSGNNVQFLSAGTDIIMQLAGSTSALYLPTNPLTTDIFVGYGDASRVIVDSDTVILGQDSTDVVNYQASSVVIPFGLNWGSGALAMAANTSGTNSSGATMSFSKTIIAPSNSAPFVITTTPPALDTPQVNGNYRSTVDMGFLFSAVPADNARVELWTYRTGSTNRFGPVGMSGVAATNYIPLHADIGPNDTWLVTNLSTGTPVVNVLSNNFNFIIK